MNYTKGEWKSEFNGHTADMSCAKYSVVTDRELICDLNRISDNKKTEANAHLIAAAPDMYEALKIFASQEYLIGTGTWQLPYDKILQIQQAIEKAEGK